MKIFKSYGSLLNNEEGIRFEFSKHDLIYMCPNIPNDNGKFFHRMLEEFTIGFRIFINQFKLPRKEITLKKRRSETIILNTISNSLHKKLMT